MECVCMYQQTRLQLHYRQMCGCLVVPIQQVLYNLTNHLFIINLIDILYLLHACIVNESRIQLKWH